MMASVLSLSDSNTTIVPKKVLTAIHNIPKDKRRSHSSETHRPRGKENLPPGVSGARLLPVQRSGWPNDESLGSALRTTDNTAAWAPKNGKIIIKVHVPSTDDIWKLRVAEEVTLEEFRARVEEKIGFPPVFLTRSENNSGAVIHTEKAFRKWVETRVRNGRNHPITAVHAPPESID